MIKFGSCGFIPKIGNLLEVVTSNVTWLAVTTRLDKKLSNRIKKIA